MQERAFVVMKGHQGTAIYYNVLMSMRKLTFKVPMSVLQNGALAMLVLT